MGRGLSLGDVGTAPLGPNLRSSGVAANLPSVSSRWPSLCLLRVASPWSPIFREPEQNELSKPRRTRGAGQWNLVLVSFLFILPEARPSSAEPSGSCTVGAQVCSGKQVAPSFSPPCQPQGARASYRGWRQPLRPLLGTWRRRDIHWAWLIDLLLFIFFLSGRAVPSSARALQLLYKLFSSF